MLTRLIYNALIILWALLLLPKVGWQTRRYQKYRGTLKSRLLGPKIGQDHLGKRLIWVHAVSVGESNAAIPLIRYYKQAWPDSYILMSCTTKTAAEHIKRHIPEVDHQIYFPLDLSWVMRRLLRAFKPALIIVMESEFWLNFFNEGKKIGAKVILANGKMSERSYRRLKALKLFSKRLFAPFDVCCMQSEAYAKRVQPFLSSHTQLVITGNLKFDLEKKTMTEQEKTEFRALLGIADGENVILLASTHENEESLLVQSLKPLLDQHIIHRLLIAPRHPERFERVIHELNTMNIPCERFRERLNHPVIVINQMGIMDSCYQMADLVIMGGSFNPHIGGHNILEPILFCRPTLFGPYMSAQRELVRLALQFQAAAQVNQEELAQSVLKHLDPTQHPMLKNNMQALLKSVKGATQKTIKAID